MKRRPGWLSVKEVADYWRVHEETVYRAIRRGELAHRRFPTGRIVVAEDAAEQFARPGEITTSHGIGPQ